MQVIFRLYKHKLNLIHSIVIPVKANRKNSNKKENRKKNTTKIAKGNIEINESWKQHWTVNKKMKIEKERSSLM